MLGRVADRLTLYNAYGVKRQTVDLTTTTTSRAGRAKLRFVPRAAPSFPEEAIIMDLVRGNVNNTRRSHDSHVNPRCLTVLNLCSRRQPSREKILFHLGLVLIISTIVYIQAHMTSTNYPRPLSGAPMPAAISASRSLCGAGSFFNLFTARLYSFVFICAANASALTNRRPVAVA